MRTLMPPAHDRAFQDALRVLFARLSNLNALWLIGLGLSIVLGGPTHMLGRGYRAFLEVAANTGLGASPHLLWGLPSVASGLILLVGLYLRTAWSIYLRWFGYATGGAMAYSFALAFTVAAANDIIVGLTATPTYIFTGSVQLLMLYSSIQLHIITRARQRMPRRTIHPDDDLSGAT